MKVMNKRTRTILQLIIGTVGAAAGLLGVSAFQQNILMGLPVGFRMILLVLAYWVIAAVPFGIMLAAKETPSDYGFSKAKIGLQAAAGILTGLCMSLVFTLIPILCGKGDWVDNGHHYRELWQFVYDFVYAIAAVGLVEEFVFRGFLYKKVKDLSGSSGAAIAVSSVLFGLFHFLGGNVIQMICTGILGVIWCVCKEKIRNCTLLSLIIAHGVYDALITVWSSVL